MNLIIYLSNYFITNEGDL